MAWRSCWLTAAYDDLLRLWCPASGKLLHALRYHGGPCQHLAVDAANRVVLVAAVDCSVYVYNLEDPIPLGEPQGGGSHSVGPALTEGGHLSERAGLVHISSERREAPQKLHRPRNSTAACVAANSYRLNACCGDWCFSPGAAAPAMHPASRLEA